MLDIFDRNSVASERARVKQFRTYAAIAAAVLLIGISIAIISRRGSPEESLDRELAEIIPRIESAIGLKFREPPRIDTRTREEVRAFLLAQLDDSSTARDLVGQEIALKLFGMLPDSVVLRESLLGVLEEQIAGFYDPKVKVLYVVDGSDPMIRDITLTHELVHALQDQYVSLDSIQKIRGNDDQQLAAQAVMEGQATFEQLNIMLGQSGAPPGGWTGVRELIRGEQAKMPKFSAAPLVVQEMLLFPYLGGAEFVRQFKQHFPDSLVLHHIPTSTEQMLHTAAFFGTHDAPTRVTIPAPGGSVVYENTLGEFGVRLFLFATIESESDALRGAMGWDGDRFAVFPTPAGNGLAWVTVWDSPVDAGEFQDLLALQITRRFRKIEAFKVPAERRPGTINGVEYRAGGRRFLVAAAEVSGRPAVVLVDVPEGASTSVFDIRQARAEQLPR